MTQPAARCPALLIAAPASGQGKTTVTAALARLHARRGLRVQVFKCGPDFLDPHWHQLASGQPVHQLDLWMNGEADCRQRLHAAAQSADWMGALMRVSHGDAPAASKQGAALLPERHLGLVAAHELADSAQRLDAAADALAATPLGQMTAQDLQRWAVDFPVPDNTTPVPTLLAGRTVAVGRDAAFCFTYAANLQTLEQLGARSGPSAAA